jgi:IS5 family transposase
MVCKEQNQHEQHRLRDQMFVRYNLQLEEANNKKRKAGGDVDSGGPSGSQSNKRRRPR